jgi:hypothetical protein
MIFFMNREAATPNPQGASRRTGVREREDVIVSLLLGQGDVVARNPFSQRKRVPFYSEVHPTSIRLQSVDHENVVTTSVVSLKSD